jgi:hypothetical protein
MLERLKRNAIVACLAMAVLAAALARSLSYAAAVLAGGLLIGASFWSISRGVDQATAARRTSVALVAVAGRYALLAFLAYVMIARLRLPPLGLIAGASSFAVAAALESVILLRKKH